MEKKDSDFFINNGYFILKNAVDEEFCDKVIKNAKNVFKESLGNDYDKKFNHIKCTNYNRHLKNLKDIESLKYNFSNVNNDILNQIANTKNKYSINSGACIASFKSDNSEEINWHIDGWEHHWLNQPLHSTCVIAYTDTNEGTWIAQGSDKIITELFYKHQFMLHCELFLEYSPLTNKILNQCEIKQIPLKKGDMIILHPFLLHAANINKTQDIRLITNFHLYKEININNPKSLVELKTNKDLIELNLNPKEYKLDTDQNLEPYEPMVLRDNHDKEYEILKKQLIYFQKNNIINKDNKNYMKNNFNENNDSELDTYNKNIYHEKKKLFLVRPSIE